MRYFYAFMLWLVEVELAIARSTGRNPAQIRALTNDRERWLRSVQLNDIQRRFAK